MKNFGAKWLSMAAVLGAVAGVSLNGCGGGDGGGTGKGGTTGSGGRGGTTGSAGATGTAGRGGTTGSAGSTSTGGRGGTTGTAGTGGGTAGTGGTAPALNCPRATFNTTDEGFVLNMYNNGAGNLFNREAGAKAAAAFEPNQGDPANGSIKIDAPFDNYSQFVDLVKGYSATTLQNWTGATKLHVRVKVASGFNPSASNPAGVMPYVQTTSGFVDCRQYINVVAGNGWNDYALDFATCPATWKASEVIGYGVQLDTGNGAMGDGGVNPDKPTTAVLYVDSFYLDGTCTGGTGGTGGGTAGTGGGTAGTGGGTGGSTAGTGGGTAGSTAGTGGGTAGTGGGTAGTGGGAAGRGGTTGTGGGAAGTGGGAAGTGGGAAGTGGAATTTLYDFESGVQGWAPTTAVSASPDQHLDGAQSLKVTYGVLDGTNTAATIDNPALWPGTVLTFHVFLPTGFDTTGGAYFQAFSQSNNYKLFDTNGNGARTGIPGAWTTWTYTIPNTFPGGLQQLGFQLGDNAAGNTIPAGSVYLDAITATGGTVNCAVATGTGAHTFEPIDGGGLNPMYQKDGSDADTVASQSSDRFNSGTGSWKVAFTGLPAPASAGTPTSRRVFIDKPNIYCGQIATVHVYLPAGSDNLTFQVFAQYNNYAGFVGTSPTSVTRDAWNTYAYTVPANVGPGGIQRLGVQFLWAGTTAFTGNVYIDDVTW